MQAIATFDSKVPALVHVAQRDRRVLERAVRSKTLQLERGEVVLAAAGSLRCERRQQEVVAVERDVRRGERAALRLADEREILVEQSEAFPAGQHGDLACARGDRERGLGGVVRRHEQPRGDVDRRRDGRRSERGRRKQAETDGGNERSTHSHGTVLDGESDT